MTTVFCKVKASNFTHIPSTTAMSQYSSDDDDTKSDNESISDLSSYSSSECTSSSEYSSSPSSELSSDEESESYSSDTPVSLDPLPIPPQVTLEDDYRFDDRFELKENEEEYANAEEEEKAILAAHENGFHEEIDCRDNCHHWHRLEDKEFPLFGRKLFIHTGLADDKIYCTADPTDLKEMNYCNLVEKVLSNRILLEMVRATNFRARVKRDRGYIPLPDNKRGILMMKIYLCILITHGLREDGEIRDLWSQDWTVGRPDLNMYMSYRRFTMINKHICLNRWNTRIKDPHKFRRFWTTLTRIRNNSMALIDPGHIYSLDEIRFTATAKTHSGKTKMDKKPKTLAVDAHSCATATQKHCGFVSTSLPYCGARMYDKNLRIHRKEKKMDNYVNQVIYYNTQTDDEIYVMDSRYTSVYVATEVARKRECAIVGVISRARRCLPKSFWKDGSDGALEIKALQKGEYIQFRDEEHQLNLTIWQDTETVWLLDNCINPFARGEVTRQDDDQRVTYLVPYVCRFYNKHMGNCDAAGKHRSDYEIDIKSKRHHNRTFLGLLDFYAFVNPALVVTDNYGRRTVQHRKLRRQLVLKWTSDYKKYLVRKREFKRKPKPITMEARQNSTNLVMGMTNRSHHQVKYRAKKGSTSDQVRCWWCEYQSKHNNHDPNNPKEAKWTTYICDTCQPPIGLCRNWGRTNPPNRTCFEEYHRRFRPDDHCVPI